MPPHGASSGAACCAGELAPRRNNSSAAVAAAISARLVAPPRAAASVCELVLLVPITCGWSHPATFCASPADARRTSTAGAPTIAAAAVVNVAGLGATRGTAPPDRGLIRRSTVWTVPRRNDSMTSVEFPMVEARMSLRRRVVRSFVYQC